MNKKTKDQGIREIDISELSFDDRNANQGTELGQELLQTSISKYGVGRGVLADKNLKLIAGNHAVKEMKEQGIEKVIVVPTDGKTLVVTQRTDIEKDSKVGHELALADNRVNQANLNFDFDVINELNEEFNLDLADMAIDISDLGFSDDADEDDYRGKDNSKSSGGETIDGGSYQSYFPLTISLTKEERAAFDKWKKKKKLVTDTEAFQFMFKMCKTL